jgi:hypothetical protein
MFHSASIFLNWPHDRFLLGWGYTAPDKHVDYHSFELFLTIVSIQVNWT